MFSKSIKIIFIVLVMGMISLPYIFATREEISVSEEENRILNQQPSFIVDGKLNVAKP